MNLITSKQRSIAINLDNELVADWFARSNDTQANLILHQMSVEREYDAVLANKQDLVILDIGANIGLFSLYAQDSAKHIYAIEPTPTTLNVLTQMVGDNKKITIVPIALSDHNGQVDFYVHDNPTINSANVDQNGQKVTVDARTIESILDQYKLDQVDFVKCDIEGGEMDAITQALLEPVFDRIHSWHIGVHQTNRSETTWPGNLESNRQTLIARLTACGYKAIPIQHDVIFAWKE